MKKFPLLLILISATLLTSCGRSGWNCKNRYCSVPVEKPQTVSKPQDNLQT